MVEYWHTANGYIPITITKNKIHDHKMQRIVHNSKG